MLVALSAYLVLSAQGSAKKPLDHSVYDSWKSIRNASFSDDGKWFAYQVVPQEGDSFLHIAPTEHRLPDIGDDRGINPHFSADSKFCIYTKVPPFAAAKKARIDKVKPEDQPKNQLVIFDLEKQSSVIKDRVAEVRYAKEDHHWIAFRSEPPKSKPETKPADAKTPAKPDVDEDQRRPRAAGGSAAPAGEAKTIKPGDTWTLYNCVSGQEEVLSEVSDLAIAKNGSVVAYAIASKDAAKDGVWIRDLSADKPVQVVAGEGHYSHLAVNDAGSLIAFLTDKDSYKDETPTLALYRSSAVRPKPILTAKVESVGLPKGWAPADSSLSFSSDGWRVFFHTAPKPATEKKSDIPDEDKAQLDIWTYKDDRIQSVQNHDLATDKARSYLAYADIRSNKIVQVGSSLLRVESVGDKGSANAVLEATDIPYLRESSWNPDFRDLYRLDVNTGKATKLVTHRKFDFATSSNGKVGLWFDLARKQFSGISVATGAVQELAKPNVSFTDELDDHPDVAPMYGIAGFTTDDRAIVYDRYDIWAFDPTGKKPAESLTGGTGRRRHFVFRVDRTNYDPETDVIDLSKPLLLTVLDDDYERSGFYRLEGGHLTQLILGEHEYAGVVKAKEGTHYAFTEATSSEYPDYWLTDTSFKNPVKATNANPQQSQYVWAKAEQVHWLSNDGHDLKGILYTPENLDRTKKYPMITYYYERNSEHLYSYLTPAPSASTVNIAYFVSNGYVVFVPDIDYQIGYPGPSAVSAIVSGVQAMLQKGYIDPKRLGIQGQSWGGYQTAYLVTQTNLFAAAGAGAPVGDMFSAYGGIRFESGLVREFQYEHSQSRIGGTIWQKPLQYLLNSPVFFADRVQTPLLIMSNDADGAVPHSQGIEFFTDLRRLNKPSWLLVYNGEAHNLVQRKNRKDLSVRLAQFFDHFLKGAPMPVWMSKGVPAIEKGKNYGFDYDDQPEP